MPDGLTPEKLQKLQDEVKQHWLIVRRMGVTKSDGMVHVAFRVRGKAKYSAFLQTRVCKWMK